MKIISTVFTGSDLEWKIKISPRRNAANKAESVPIFNVWTPNDSSGFTALIYNPTISLVPNATIKRSDINRANMFIPIDQIYIFTNMLQQVYKDLSTPKLFNKSPEGQLIMDKNLMNKFSRKLKLYSGDLVIAPAVTYDYNEETYGVYLYSNGDYVGAMNHKDIRRFCEIINHLDIQVYSLLLNMVEQNIELTNKIDKLTCDVSDIKNLLTAFIKAQQQSRPIQQQPEKKIVSADQAFQWSNLPQGGGLI